MRVPWPAIRRTVWRLPWPGSGGRSWSATRELYRSAADAEKHSPELIEPRHRPAGTSSPKEGRRIEQEAAGGACLTDEDPSGRQVLRAARGRQHGAGVDQGRSHLGTRRQQFASTDSGCGTHRCDDIRPDRRRPGSRRACEFAGPSLAATWAVTINIQQHLPDVLINISLQKNP